MDADDGMPALIPREDTYPDDYQEDSDAGMDNRQREKEFWQQMDADARHSTRR